MGMICQGKILVVVLSPEMTNISCGDCQADDQLLEVAVQMGHFSVVGGGGSGIVTLGNSLII